MTTACTVVSREFIHDSIDDAEAAAHRKLAQYCRRRGLGTPTRTVIDIQHHPTYAVLTITALTERSQAA